MKKNFEAVIAPLIFESFLVPQNLNLIIGVIIIDDGLFYDRDGVIKKIIIDND